MNRSNMPRPSQQDKEAERLAARARQNRRQLQISNHPAQPEQIVQRQQQQRHLQAEMQRQLSQQHRHPPATYLEPPRNSPAPQRHSGRLTSASNTGPEHAYPYDSHGQHTHSRQRLPRRVSNTGAFENPDLHANLECKNRMDQWAEVECAVGFKRGRAVVMAAFVHTLGYGDTIRELEPGSQQIRRKTSLGVVEVIGTIDLTLRIRDKEPVLLVDVYVTRTKAKSPRCHLFLGAKDAGLIMDYSEAPPDVEDEAAPPPGDETVPSDDVQGYPAVPGVTAAPMQRMRSGVDHTAPMIAGQRSISRVPRPQAQAAMGMGVNMPMGNNTWQYPPGRTGHQGMGMYPNTSINDLPQDIFGPFPTMPGQYAGMNFTNYDNYSNLTSGYDMSADFEQNSQYPMQNRSPVFNQRLSQTQLPQAEQSPSSPSLSSGLEPYLQFPAEE